MEKSIRSVRSPLLAALAASALLVGTGPANSDASGENELPAVLDQVRTVLGLERLAALKHPLHLGGRATLNGVAGDFSLIYGADGRFIQEFLGPIFAIQAHDGDTTWMLQPTGSTVDLELADREMILTHLWVQSGYWLHEDAPLEIRLDRSESDSLTAVLHIAFAGGIYSGTLAIDRESGLPSSWSSVEMGRRVLTRFERYRKHRGITVPTRVIVTVDGRRQLHAAIDTIKTLKGPEDRVYARRENPELEVRFSHERPAELEIVARGSGHLLVRPLLNGRDLGWFLFDTGAVGTILSEKLVETLALETLGATEGVGVGGDISLSIAKLDHLQLGRLDLKNLPVGVMDLDGLARQIDPEMVGIIGNNIIGQAVIEYDAAAPRIALYDPASYELPSGAWQALTLSSGKPVARVRFEGHEGLFTMDTAASGSLLIHAPTVARHQLLEDRETRMSFSYGVGGAIVLQAGHLEWVEFGGRRFENLPVLFATKARGTSADRLRDGILGVDLMSHFRIVFNYPHKRIALLEQEPPNDGQ